MAVKLNGNRILLSKISLIGIIMVILFTRQYFGEKNHYHEFFEALGVTLIAICAMGRIYSTAYLGGFKNEKLITHGIYSVMRNPLYFFSLIGATGAAFLSNHLIIMMIVPVGFLLIYSYVIKREYIFLKEKFGQEYVTYCENVPALYPKFSHYSAPKIVEMCPHFMKKAFFDALWWLSIFPIIEFIEYLHNIHVIPTFFIT